MLRSNGQWMPDRVFCNPHILGFLISPISYKQRDLETAMLRDMGAFLLKACIGANHMSFPRHGRERYDFMASHLAASPGVC